MAQVKSSTVDRTAQFPIIGEKAYNKVNLPTYGSSIITAEVIDFRPRLESWRFHPSYVDDDPIHPNKDEVVRPAQWEGLDQTICIVTLTDEESNEYRRHASLCRAIRPARFEDWDITWRTSCMSREQNSIRIRRNGDVEKRRHGSEYDMVWELAGPGPISLRDNLQRLANETHRLFEPKMQNRI